MAILIWTLFLFVACAYSELILHEESVFRLESHAPRSRVKHTEKLTFSFGIQLNASAEMNKMDVTINSSNLQIWKASSLKDTEFVWKDNGGNIIETDQKQLNVNVKQDSVLGADVDSAVMSVALQYGELTLSSFKGFIVMFVPDTATLGSILRSCMYVAVYTRDQVTITDYILAEYAFTELPKMELSLGNPLQIDMKEKSKVNSKIVLPSGPMGQSVLKVYMPNNITVLNDATDLYIEEPFLSVTEFKTTGSTGLSDDSTKKATHIDPTYLSHSKSSENDEVMVIIPPLELKTVVGELNFMAEAEMLDFFGAVENTEMMMCYVLMVGDGFFVVRNTSVFTVVKHEVDRMPNMMISLDHMGTYDAGTKILLQLGLDHEPDSWGSAYNISWLWYMPPFIGDVVSLGKVTDLLRRGKEVYTLRGRDVMELEAKRSSFVHQIRVQMNITVDTEHDTFERGEEFVIVSETIYNNWRGGEELGTIQEFPVKVGKSPKQEGMILCECSEDGLSTCTCSADNACGKAYSGVVCVNCSTPWECVKTIPEHGLESSLHDDLDNTYTCGRALRNRKSWEMTPCIKQSSNKTAKELHPKLGTLLGKTIGSLDLYGISRNGLAYMVSQDDGDTWYSVGHSVYQNASEEMDFMHASFK